MIRGRCTLGTHTEYQYLSEKRPSEEPKVTTELARPLVASIADCKSAIQKTACLRYFFAKVTDTFNRTRRQGLN